MAKVELFFSLGLNPYPRNNRKNTKEEELSRKIMPLLWPKKDLIEYWGLHIPKNSPHSNNYKTKQSKINFG